MAAADDFKDLMKEEYMSVVNVYSSAKNKWNICQTRWQAEMTTRDGYTTGSADWNKHDRRMRKWKTLSTHCKYLWAHIKNESEDVGGVADKAEQILTNLSLTSEIVDFGDYSDVRTVGPLSFNAGIAAPIKDKTATWDADDSSLRTTTVPWHTQWINVFDSLIFDTYKAAGMAIYYDGAVTAIPRSSLPVIAHWPWTMALFDVCTGQGESFLHFGRGCLAKMDVQMRQFLGAEDTPRQKMIRRAEYWTRGADTLDCIDGLWLINYADLTADQKLKVEDTPLEFDVPT